MITEDQSAVIAFLSDPATHGSVGPVKRIDTHGAVVFLVGDRAYKLKRAVLFDYMDFSTLDKRRTACAAEIVRNSETAPGIYRRAMPIARAAGDGLVLGGEGEPQAVLEVALMETARPLLIAPPTAAKTFGRSVIIAWNGSVEAIRAVSSALPYLTRAESVIILVIGEGDRPPALPDDLKTYFAWHGIAATGKQVAAESAPVGARLLEEADAAGADLLVMGGYTHSRLRQLIFGGVTSHVLHHAELPVLMAH